MDFQGWFLFLFLSFRFPVMLDLSEKYGQIVMMARLEWANFICPQVLRTQMITKIHLIN